MSTYEFVTDLKWHLSMYEVLLNCLWYNEPFISIRHTIGNLLMTSGTKHLPGHVGVNELPVGFVGLIEQFVLTTELGIS